jgi:sialate O-acetylesterase
MFHPAALTIEGEMVLARAAAVPEPVAVRYAWANAPEVSLYNGAGLPAAPFRSDNW